MTPPERNRLTVRLLVSGASTWTSKLLWLRASWVGNKEGTVVCDESSLQLILGVLIDVLLVVGDKRLCNSLTDGVDLGSVATTGNTDADIDVGELIETDNQEWLVKL
jgi:hypothetical protein